MGQEERSPQAAGKEPGKEDGPGDVAKPLQARRRGLIPIGEWIAQTEAGRRLVQKLPEVNNVPLSVRAPVKCRSKATSYKRNG
jgi:hypothetical protein